LKVIDRDNLRSVDGAARADKLRRHAALLRRAASHPTEGGKRTDRILITMAQRLEREAETGAADAAPRDIHGRVGGSSEGLE
jgi:hypothetical protein